MGKTWRGVDRVNLGYKPGLDVIKKWSKTSGRRCGVDIGGGNALVDFADDGWMFMLR